MNIRMDLYCSGAALTVRFVQQRRSGRRVAVLDTTRRTRAAVTRMLLGGMTTRDIARRLDIPVPAVRRLGIAGLQSRQRL